MQGVIISISGYVLKLPSSLAESIVRKEEAYSHREIFAMGVCPMGRVSNLCTKLRKQEKVSYRESMGDTACCKLRFEALNYLPYFPHKRAYGFYVRHVHKKRVCFTYSYTLVLSESLHRPPCVSAESVYWLYSLLLLKPSLEIT